MAGRETAGGPLKGSHNANPFVCNICKKSYTRLDHLGRHHRTHIAEKPFTCDKCGKSFARIDLLRRHRNNHSANGTIKAPTRHRTARACLNCAEAKLKCDDSSPCRRCLGKDLRCDKASSSARPPAEDAAQENTAPIVKQDRSQSTTNGVGFGLSHASSPSPNASFPVEQGHPPMPTSTSFPHSVETQDVEPPVVDHSEIPMDMDIMYDDQASNSFDMTMGSFLKDIMNPMPSSGFETNDIVLPDVLDFTFDDLMGFEPILDRGANIMPASTTSFLPPSNDQTRGLQASGTLTPNVKRAADIGQQAFRESMWLWTPGKDDRHSTSQVFSSLPTHAIAAAQSPGTPLPCHLSLAARDRLLSCILRLCDRDVARVIVTRFPTTELLSTIIESFMAYQHRQTLPWIHLPTLDFDEIREEYLLTLVASGAANSRHLDIRKLGLAMQETARFAVGDMFEEDNRTTRDLAALQANGVHLEVGLWSGVRRRMEIAESFMLPFVTMLRRGGRFQDVSNRRMPALGLADLSTGMRWQHWVETESMKRIAFHVLYEDTCTSMALFNPPLISPLELSLELPHPPEMWKALNANDWLASLPACLNDPHGCAPSYCSCIADIHVLIRNQAAIDVQMSLLVVVCSIWSRVWQWRQMKMLSTLVSGSPNNLPVSSYHQELISTCQQISMSESDITGGFDSTVALLLEVCQLHLYVSLEDIQLFAGKQGHEEARKIVASLRSWTKVSDSRQAILHAGQILRHASRFSFGFLTGFSAIAVYHASLVLWAYAVLSEPTLDSLDALRPPNPQLQNVVRLDDDPQASGNLQRFLMLGKGQPCLLSHQPYDETHNSQVTLLTDAAGVMESVTNLLKCKNGAELEMPPVVSNLVKLMHSLGKAASLLKRPEI